MSLGLGIVQRRIRDAAFDHGTQWFPLSTVIGSLSAPGVHRSSYRRAARLLEAQGQIQIAYGSLPGVTRRHMLLRASPVNNKDRRIRLDGSEATVLAMSEALAEVERFLHERQGSFVYGIMARTVKRSSMSLLAQDAFEVRGSSWGGQKFKNILTGALADHRYMLWKHHTGSERLHPRIPYLVSVAKSLALSSNWIPGDGGLILSAGWMMDLHARASSGSQAESWAWMSTDLKRIRACSDSWFIGETEYAKTEQGRQSFCRLFLKPGQKPTPGDWKVRRPWIPTGVSLPIKEASVTFVRQDLGRREAAPPGQGVP